MCAGVTVASDTAIFVPPLRADTLKNAPNFVDGGASFKLSRAGAAQRPIDFGFSLIFESG